MEKRIIPLLALLLLTGYATRAFAQSVPSEAPLSRAGAVALMVEADPALKQRLQFFIKHTPPMPLFDDVEYTQWYAPYIETAFEAGLVTGSDDARFRPSDRLAEEESIVLVNRFYALKHPGTPRVTAKPGEDWFTVAANAALAQGIQLPSPIRLGQPVSRSAYFTMLRSSGAANPELLAISYQPNPTPVIVRQPTQGLRPLVAPRPAVAVAPRSAVQQRPTVVAQAVTPVPTATAGFSISLPSLGISNLHISHPSNPTTKDGLLAPLQSGVGHLFSYPGAGGTILVYGHSSGYAWDVSKYTKIFRQINKLAVGDKVTINYGGKAYTYQVTYKQSVLASDMSAYKGGNGEELILYTCWPPDSIKERYLVHASPVSEVAQR